MSKVKETPNRVVVHVGDLWKKYHRASPKTRKRWQFRIKDVGRTKHSELILCKPPNKDWQVYGWSFSKKQVRKGKRSLLVHDAKAFEILQELKESGELRGWKLVFRS
ncbi:MAG: hypothetical protein DRN91_07620 [Candidatus Alkanophagales archaeon]|nr:MAG: hypothetical protein DRN91_07620 [Candidatus Alkanophagales archaeon]